MLQTQTLSASEAAGLGATRIVGAAQRTRRSGHRLTVVPGPAHVQRVFKLTGAADVLDHGWRPQRG